MSFSLRQFGTETLSDTHTIFLELVKAGTADTDVGINQFGEIAMRIDVAAEEVILKSLRDYSVEHSKGINVVSEEHGELTIGDNPQLTAFIDGLDGSSVFRSTKGTARCGTMFALYEGLNPKFNDYLLAGIADHVLGKSVLAVKGEGVQLIEGAKTSSVSTSGHKALDDSTRIYIDEGVQNYPDFPDQKRNYFYEPIKRSFNTNYLGSSAVYFFDLAYGEADLVLEYGRKNNLEHMSAYPLVIESGGVMEFMDEGELGPISYSDYCKINGGYPAIIAASSTELAQAVRDYV